MTDRPNLYAIEAGQSFVDILARGVMGRAQADLPDDPLALARTTILVPTRRAVRSLRDAFLRASEGRPLLLPHMLPLGDLDEDAAMFAEDPGDAEAANPGLGEMLPPVIGGLRRQLLLARLVRHFEGLSWNAAPDEGQAVELAAELARLQDQMETERIGPDALAAIAPDDAGLAAHWQQVIRFLSIVTSAWPAKLAEEGAIGPAERRNRLLELTAAAWRQSPPDGWVIAAGSTGSIPATADLLRAVAGLPLGCVVLPGLDFDLPDADWPALNDSHPQFGMARLLAHLGATRDAVRPFAADWPLLDTAPGTDGVPGSGGSANGYVRGRLLSGVMGARPAVPDGIEPGAALSDVCWIDAPSPAEEAAAIALMMRHALETPGRTAALVTPDRALARRVAARLGRWDIAVDDSAGQPLATTIPGVFLRLIAEMAASDFAPIPTLSCLKHPLAAGGMRPAEFRANVRLVERHAIRGPRPAPGLKGIIGRLENALDEMAGPRGGQDRVEAESVRAAVSWLTALDRRLAPLQEMIGVRQAGHAAPEFPVVEILRAHVAAAEALAQTEDEPGADRLWRNDAGEALAAFVLELEEAAGTMPPMAADGYPSLFDALLAGRVVRRRFGGHPRLSIWGPLEARLQHADLMILGGLNEGTWPADPGNDPWMSRPQRQLLGLPLPERRIGLAAHDFTQAFAAPAVALTRSQRVGGAPAVPSRWLTRLATALPEAVTDAMQRRGQHWLGLVATLDHPRTEEHVPAGRPAPCPPVEARPRKLSVTRIETWQVNPYAIFARYILELEALDPLDADPGAADRGIFIHRALERFLERHGDELPPGGPPAVARALIEIGAAEFATMGLTPGLYAFWWPRFERVAHWFAEVESTRRDRARPLKPEAWGVLELPGPAGPFRLTGMADRIDALEGGGLAVVDYKTGSVPKAGVQRQGFAPQLPLLGAMAEAGAFRGLKAGKVEELAFWKLSGSHPPGEQSAFKESPDDAIPAAVEGLKDLIARFDDPEMPYAPYVVAELRPRFDDYAHLARAKEWSSIDPGDGD